MYLWCNLELNLSAVPIDCICLTALSGVRAHKLDSFWLKLNWNMHSRSILECPLSSWRTLVPGSTAELVRSDIYCRCWFSAPALAVQVFSCLSSQCRTLGWQHARESWTESSAVLWDGSRLPQCWEACWGQRSRIWEVNSCARYSLSSSPFLFLLCAQGTGDLASCSVKAREQACSSRCAWDKLPGSQSIVSRPLTEAAEEQFAVCAQVTVSV